MRRLIRITRRIVRQRSREERGAAAVLALLILVVTAMTGLDAGRSAAFDIRASAAVADSVKNLGHCETGMEAVRWDHAQFTNMKDECEPVASTFKVSNDDPCYEVEAEFDSDNCTAKGTTHAICQTEAASSGDAFRTLNWFVRVSSYPGCDNTKPPVCRISGYVHAMVPVAGAGP